MTIEDNPANQNPNVNNSYSLHRWMTDLHSVTNLHQMRISEFSCPCAHNCGMDLAITESDSYHACQDGPIRDQLNHGIRALDIRIRWFNGRPGGLADKFSTVHGDGQGRSFGYVMAAVVQFLQANPGEIVLLDFHEISVQGNYTIPYKDLYNYMLDNYKEYLLPASAEFLTISEIKNQYPGPRMVAAMPSQVWEHGGPVRDRTYFWDKIKHEWIGKSLVSVTELKEYIGAVMDNPPFNDYPWSLSATAYTLTQGPKVIIEDLKSWFGKGNNWQIRSNIINFDWCTRMGAVMIRQCIESNRKSPAPLYQIVSPRNEEVVYARQLRVQGYGVAGATLTLAQSRVGGHYGGGLLPSSIYNVVSSVPPGGNFSLTSNLTRGGRVSRWSPNVSFSYFNTLPAPIISTPANGTFVTSRTPQISGYSGVPGAKVRLFQSGSGAIVHGELLVGHDGYFAGPPTIEFQLGWFPLTCDQYFDDLSSGYADETKFFVTSYDPIISRPVNDELVGTVKPLIKGNGWPGATVRFYETGSGATLHGEATVLEDGTFESALAVSLPVRTFDLTCYQTLGGNDSGWSQSVKFEVTNKPKTPTVELQPGDTFVKIKFVKTDMDTVSYTYWLEGTPEKATPEENVVVDGLVPETSYNVYFVGLNNVGVRSESGVASFKCTADGRPVEFGIISNTVSNIKLGWKPPVVGAEKIERYTMTILGIPFDVGNVTVFELRNVYPNATKYFKLKSVFKDGSTSSYVELEVPPVT